MTWTSVGFWGVYVTKDRAARGGTLVIRRTQITQEPWEMKTQRPGVCTAEFNPQYHRKEGKAKQNKNGEIRVFYAYVRE